MLVSFQILVLIGMVGSPPSPIEPLARLDTRAIPEGSGIVKSRRYPGIYWVHNDSGNPPALFAVGLDGRIVREFPIAAPNIDWEDIAIDDRGRLYLGDIGNNGGALAIRMIYRIDEPDPMNRPSGPLPISAATYYVLRRSNRFDAEGLVFDNGAAIVVSKRFDGKEAELFSLPFDPPAPLLRPARPGLIGRLAGFVEPATGADLSADGRLLAVCSSTVTRIYRREADRPWERIAEVSYDPLPVEGIAWDGLDLILLSEGRGLDRIAESAWRRTRSVGTKAVER